MLGAIIGDIVGSSYEFGATKRTDFELFTKNSRFTDDSVLTVAIADCLLNNKDYAKTVYEYGRKYPYAGYGGMFNSWLYSEDPSPYNSFGNGSAMRVSPIGFAFNTEDEVLYHAKMTAEFTHNHTEGIKGAMAVAIAIFWARQGKDKGFIRDYITKYFMYDLTEKLDDIRPNYSFKVTCQESVPQAIIAFLESTDYEDAVRKAVSLGGDADTQACITGGIAQAFYKEIPFNMIKEALERLPAEFIEIINKFNKEYGVTHVL